MILDCNKVTALNLVLTLDLITLLKWREPQWQRMLHMGREAQESAAAQLLQVFESLDHLERTQTPSQLQDLVSSYIVEVEEEEEEEEEEGGECK